ncbi:MAG: tetratricopeptide repeat protein [Endomicrobia bacterium]|nr:tetratricopeptide repeat protein [Endomicrobiia bacterium]
MKILNFLKNHKTFIFISVLILLIAVVYGQSLIFDYTYFDDNELILEKVDVLKNYKNIPGYFLESYEAFYRPLLTTSFAIESFISGANPFLYHLTNVILHIISAILMFILLNRLNFNKTVVYFFTLLFAVHPAFVQAVAWIPGRNDTLIAIFTFASFIFLHDYFDYGKRNIKIVLFFVMCLLGLFTKETMVVMIVIVPAFMFLFCRNVIRRDYFVIMAGLLILSGIYFTARFYALSGLGVSAHAILINIKNSLPLFLSYIEFAIIPARICLFNVEMPVDFLILASLIIVLIPLSSTLFFKRERKNIIIFGALWFIIFMLPTFAYSVKLNYYYSHRLYLASFGIIIMFLEFFTVLLQKYEFLKKYFVILFSVLICIFSISSYWQSKKFTNRLYFLSNALIESPNIADIRSRVALYYADKGMFEEAKKEIFRALELAPDKLIYYENLGCIYALEKDYERAKEVFETVLQKNPNRKISLYTLSQLYYISGNKKEALDFAERLINLYPKNIRYKTYYDKVKENIE